jgi:putative transposase
MIESIAERAYSGGFNSSFSASAEIGRQLFTGLIFLLTLITLPLLNLSAHAEEPRFNQVTLRAEASQDIPHDLMQVTLFSEAQERDPAKLAARITESLNQAVVQARKVKAVEISQGNRHSYPVYSDNGKQIIAWRGRPQVIRCDNGPENISSNIQRWAQQWGIRFEYIQPGKPQQNAYVERFNRTVRYEWLSQYYWSDLEEVQMHATQWMWKYNHDRPNMALGGITPKQRLAMVA